MIDLHTHSLMSDGSLLPSELARRAEVSGYTALAITDHADESNIDGVIGELIRVSRSLNARGGLKVIPGVELTHIPPADIARMVKKARRLGALVVVGHGETIAEPVSPGTNMAFIRAGVDILAHPGLIGEAEVREAKAKSVLLEITARSGHSLSNGHVARAALENGAGLVLNTDSHGPGDLITDEAALRISMGAGLNQDDFKRIQDNAKAFVKKVS